MMAVAAISAHAQKYALVDMEYILRNIPAYERANEQLNQMSRKWQTGGRGAQSGSKHHVQELSERGGIPLTGAEEGEAGLHYAEGEGSQRPEEEILRCRRRALQEARGTDGTYPGGEIYNAVKEISTCASYSLVLDRASNNGIIFWLAKK